jgi:hypothetical protein
MKSRDLDAYSVSIIILACTYQRIRFCERIHCSHMTRSTSVSSEILVDATGIYFAIMVSAASKKISTLRRTFATSLHALPKQKDRFVEWFLNLCMLENDLCFKIFFHPIHSNYDFQQPKHSQCIGRSITIISHDSTISCHVEIIFIKAYQSFAGSSSASSSCTSSPSNGWPPLPLAPRPSRATPWALLRRPTGCSMCSGGWTAEVDGDEGILDVKIGDGLWSLAVGGLLPGMGEMSSHQSILMDAPHLFLSVSAFVCISFDSGGKRETGLLCGVSLLSLPPSLSKFCPSLPPSTFLSHALTYALMQ